MWSPPSPQPGTCTRGQLVEPVRQGRGAGRCGPFAEYFTTKRRRSTSFRSAPQGRCSDRTVGGQGPCGQQGQGSRREDVAVVGAVPSAFLPPSGPGGGRRVFVIEVKPTGSSSQKLALSYRWDEGPGEAPGICGGGCGLRAAGALASARYLVPLAKKGGRLVVVSIFKDELDLRTMAYSELSLAAASSTPGFHR